MLSKAILLVLPLSTQAYPSSTVPSAEDIIHGDAPFTEERALSKRYVDLGDCGYGCPAVSPYDGSPPPADGASVQAGPYTITDCGGFTSDLQNRIATLYPDNIRKILSYSSPNPDQNLFKTWFKSQDNAAKVYFIFNKILNGGSVTYKGGSPLNPTILCAHKSENPPVQENYDRCFPPNGATGPAAFWLTKSATVVLCPKFFDQPANPTPRCPYRLIDQAQTQFALLVHELTHLYGDSDEGNKVLGENTFGQGEEVYDPEGAKKLDQFNNRLNPQVRIAAVFRDVAKANICPLELCVVCWWSGFRLQLLIQLWG